MKKIEEVGKLNYETTTKICNKTRLLGICVASEYVWLEQAIEQLRPVWNWPRGRKARGYLNLPNWPQIPIGKCGGPTWNVHP